MKRLGKIKLWLVGWMPPILWASLIFTLSSQSKLPSAPIGWLDLIIKQSAHIFVFFVLHLLIYQALHLTHPYAPKLMRLRIAFGLALSYALLDEFHQSFIPLRQATIVDVGFDLIGITMSHYLTQRGKPIDSKTLLD